MKESQPTVSTIGLRPRYSQTCQHWEISERVISEGPQPEARKWRLKATASVGSWDGVRCPSHQL